MFLDSDVGQNSNNHFIELSKHTKTIIKPTEYKKNPPVVLDLFLKGNPRYCFLFCFLGSSDTHITVDPFKRTARGFAVMVAGESVWLSG